VIRHRPYGIGHAYRIEPDQRVPPVPIAGEPFECRASTGPDTRSVQVELISAGRRYFLEASLVIPSERGGPGSSTQLSDAAAGKDHEAASAWQTALVDGTDFPQIYLWLSDALLRTHDFGAARAILEEASGKWPSDARFTKTLAMLYGTFGRGREAVRTLERYLEDRQDDRDGYFYAVQWIYTVHAGGAVIHNPAEDRQRAHEYADAYARARGPQAALVKQWVDYLDTEK